jgi:hypothetical protein
MTSNDFLISSSTSASKDAKKALLDGWPRGLHGRISRVFD